PGTAGCSDSAWRRTWSSRCVQPRAGPWRTARQTCCSHRCSGHVVVTMIEELGERPPVDLLAHTVGVRVGRVEVGDPAVNGRLDDRLGFGLSGGAGPFCLVAVA